VREGVGCCPRVMAALVVLPVSWPRLSRPSTTSCGTESRGWPACAGHDTGAGGLRRHDTGPRLRPPPSRTVSLNMQATHAWHMRMRRKKTVAGRRGGRYTIPDHRRAYPATPNLSDGSAA